MVDKIDAEKLKKLNDVRCPVCGGWHPFVRVCPYVKSESIIYERVKDPKDSRQTHAAIKEMRTEYFERPGLIGQILSSVEEAEKELHEALADDEKSEDKEKA